MFQNLTESQVLQNVEKAADVRFYMPVFDFIRTEIATTNEWPQTPSDDFWTLYQDRVTDYLKDMIRSNTMTLDTILNESILARINRTHQTFQRDSMQDPLNWIPRLLLREDLQEVDNGDLMLVMYYLMDTDNEDYYFDFKDYRNPKLLSGTTKAIYDPQSDINEHDYLSFKKGYVNLEAPTETEEPRTAQSKGQCLHSGPYDERLPQKDGLHAAPYRNHIFSLYFDFVILVISRFGFECWIWVLAMIDSVPGFAFFFLLRTVNCLLPRLMNSPHVVCL